MVDWVSIPIIKQTISGLSHLKKYFDLNAKEKQLKNWEQDLKRLRYISEENSKNFISMIDFKLHKVFDVSIHAQDHEISPDLKFNFSITNHSIFDFKTKKISLLINYEGSELGRIEISKEIDLPHQQTQYDRAKLDKLHPNFINRLKSLKKEGHTNSLKIVMSEIEIDFIGDKEFRKSWENSVFELEIPIEKIYVTL
jgi:hypothetical protein